MIFIKKRIENGVLHILSDSRHLKKTQNEALKGFEMMKHWQRGDEAEQIMLYKV